ncbi:hypothetical protein, conserved [Eimeria tenella]|uniref:Uncharacterized protein n=1 Tax=Eimeria tenella TaxID=5802 RepID=U6KN63_EIMTE|nr:hypothetical protein, conserved [Eimeria tenella]CDJ38276.1 hypothetical protein, conserved [Eimeria tenella]|eukprot:XP_013229114.1 hypothetical protein, conserved [Eimeria tenella]
MAVFFKLFYMRLLKAPAYPIGIDTGLKVGKTLQQRGLATDADKVYTRFKVHRNLKGALQRGVFVKARVLQQAPQFEQQQATTG